MADFPKFSVNLNTICSQERRQEAKQSRQEADKVSDKKLYFWPVNQIALAKIMYFTAPIYIFFFGLKLFNTDAKRQGKAVRKPTRFPPWALPLAYEVTQVFLIVQK